MKLASLKPIPMHFTVSEIKKSLMKSNLFLKMRKLIILKETSGTWLQQLKFSWLRMRGGFLSVERSST
jgi:hypothetical protein